jgi:hypothetical protein
MVTGTAERAPANLSKKPSLPFSVCETGPSDEWTAGMLKSGGDLAGRVLL